MTAKNSNETKDKILEMLQNWHENLGIKDFPKRLGITTNEKKFREISFRLKKEATEDNAKIDDIIVSHQPIYSFGLNHTIVGYVVTYRVWVPTLDGKIPSQWTIRFSLFPGVIGIVKINDFILGSERDNFPLQKKTIDLPRMFGITSREKLDDLAKLLIKKELPFLLGNIKSMTVRQLGDLFYQDPTTRVEETLNLLIELELNKTVSTANDLADYLDHRNRELLLHHIFTIDEIINIIKSRASLKKENTITRGNTEVFVDQYSLNALYAYLVNAGYKS